MRRVAWPLREAVARHLPPDSAAAQALAWRWMRSRDPAAAPATDLPPELSQWLGAACAHARCARLAPHLSAAQLAEVRRRQLEVRPQLQSAPALAAELRAQMRQGVEARQPVVQALARRWQQLFRDSHCGDDAALEARVRHALMLDADLRLGVEDDLLAYLQQAHGLEPARSDAAAGPKPSALLVALQRAAHQWLETPRVLDDPLAVAVLDEGERQALRADLARYKEPMALGLRSTVVVRSRLAEDEWAQARARGVRQYMVLGTGLDTSALRHPDAPGTMFEVDLPSTQAWKRQRLQAAGIPVPAALRWVPVDFETADLAQGLSRAGFDTREPAFFSWLGVTMYLPVAAVLDTLRFVTGCANGSAILFEYVVPLAQLPGMMRAAIEPMVARLTAQGEPWRACFDTDALLRTLRDMGFGGQHAFSAAELNQRYLSQRNDGLHVVPARRG
jgi:methyltransferase (TIGR00027 family)